MKKTLITVLLLVMSISVVAQDVISIFKVGGTVRNRTEFSQGYYTPILKTDTLGFPTKPTIYSSQRTRLWFDYKLLDKVGIKVSFQDVRTFGGAPSFIASDNKLSIYEAWGEIFLLDNISLKIGKMEINYDNGRLFGNNDWTNAGRTHDLLLFKYDKDFDAQIGLAYNFNTSKEEQQLNLSENKYKSIEFIWTHYTFNKLDMSAVFVNMGMPERQFYFSRTEDNYFLISENIINFQTYGGMLDLFVAPVRVSLEGYYQSGKSPNDWILTDSLAVIGLSLDEFNSQYKTNFAGNAGMGKSINAYMYSAKLMLEFTKIKFGIGYDFLSGDNIMNGKDLDNEMNAFNPLFGSNHEFYGNLDYFFQYGNSIYGNTDYTVGLKDIYTKFIFDNQKITANADFHYFLPSSTSSYLDELTQETVNLTKLGIEIDISAGIKFIPDVASLRLGYSLFKAEQGLLAIKGLSLAQGEQLNNWFWVMVKISPEIYSYFKRNGQQNK